MKLQLLIFFLLTNVMMYAQILQWNTGTPPKQANTPLDNPASNEEGYALFYADYLAGSPTALGEKYNPQLLTAAHKKLPLGTIIKVTRLDNDRSVTVRINDRGAYCDGCIVDLSRAAAQEIDLLQAGRSKVRLTVMGYSETNPSLARSNGTPLPIQQVVRSTTSTVPKSYSYPPSNFTTKGAVEPKSSTLANEKEDVKGNYSVQFGAYGTLANAERHAASLRNKGFNSIHILEMTTLDGASIHRVVASPFNALLEAENYRTNLKEYYQIEGVIISR